MPNEKTLATRCLEQGTAPAGPPASSLTPVVKSAKGQRYALIYEGQSLQRIRNGEVPMILVPGVPSTERDFRHLAPRLCAFAPVVRIIWPGFGILHDERCSPASTKERAEYLSTIADAEAWGAHVMVGHSLGGLAALAHAVHDARVVGINFISSVGVRRHRGMVVGPRGAQAYLVLLKFPVLRAAMVWLSAHLMRRVGFVGHPFHLRQVELIFRHIANLNFDDVKNNITRLSSKSHLPVGIVTTADDPIIDTHASDALVHALSTAAPDLSHLHLARGGHNPQRHCIDEIHQWLSVRYSQSLTLT